VKAIKLIGLSALTALLAMAFVGATSAMAEPTALCKADQNPCEEKNVITHVHETSVGKAVLLSSVGNTECNVLFLGDAAAVMEEGAGLGVVGSFTYTNCELGGGSCTAKEEKGPAEVQVLRTGHETATVTGEGLVHLVCSGFIDCSYNGVGLSGTAKGPLLSTQTNGEVTLTEQTTNKEAGGFLCPKTAKLDITTTPLEATYVSTPAFHLCVEYEHANSGNYTGVSSGVCTGFNATRVGKFGLVRSTRALALNAMVCVRLNELKGLWVEPKSGSTTECEGDLTGGNVGRYELGTAK
jgi:hypothetical protein